MKNKKLTPRMTEQSHKKRFTVIYEIKNRGVALGDGNRSVKTPESGRNFIRFGTVAGGIFVTLCTFFHAAGECKFEAIS